ncbi:MAG: prepilin peptidase [Phycisphaerae bacterium]|nr:prepilin peptidase [Phycisphaerae bacterium]
MTFPERLLDLGASMVPLLFALAFGACVGSLINVLVYRLPRGIGVVFPPSRCPACETRLTWRENIPVLGWMLLGGRCRFCKSPISIEYPVVEASVATLFGLFYWLWYGFTGKGVWLTVPWGVLRPEWSLAGLPATWPIFIVVLALVSCLVAMTLTDAKTYSIPLVLPWFATAVGLAGHTLWASYVQWNSGALPYVAKGWINWEWALPTPGATWSSGGGALGSWTWVAAPLGATLGLCISMLLLRFGLIRQSFADYEAWEAQTKAASATANPNPDAGSAMSARESPADLWIEYPHARREMVLELAFLAPIVIGAWIGAKVPAQVLSESALASGIPLWLSVLAGCMTGYFVGAGLVWAIRIVATLVVGREAMGLGDAHLLAAVGACVGWIDAVLTFFGAAFVGVAWEIINRLRGASARRAMQFGPCLAIAAVLIQLLKPLVEHGLGLMLRLGPGSGPMNLP